MEVIKRYEHMLEQEGHVKSKPKKSDCYENLIDSKTWFDFLLEQKLSGCETHIDSMEVFENMRVYVDSLQHKLARASEDYLKLQRNRNTIERELEAFYKKCKCGV